MATGQKSESSGSIAQLAMSERWDEVVDLLCDLNYIQARAAAKTTFDLIREFNDVLSAIPDNSEKILQEKQLLERLNKYELDLVSYAKGDLSTLEIPESTRPWDQDKTNVELERMLTNPTRLDKLRSFCLFLKQEADILETYASELPGLAIQQAWNNYNNGPVGNAAEKSTPAILANLMLRTASTRSDWNPAPLPLKILNGHTSYVEAVAMIPSGKLALSASSDRTCILWDLEIGVPLKILIGHSGSVLAVSMTPDGNQAVSASEDNTCILWDLGSGKVLKTLRSHTSTVNDVSMTSDGKLAISASFDKTCILWDLKSGSPIKTLRGHSSNVTAVVITPVGKQALSASWDKTCILWDLQSGKPLKTLNAHVQGVSAIAITPNGK